MATYANEVVAMDFSGPVRKIDERKQVYFFDNDRHLQKVVSSDPNLRKAKLDGCEINFSNFGFAKKWAANEKCFGQSARISFLYAEYNWRNTWEQSSLRTGGYNLAGNSSVEKFHRYI